MENMLDTIMLDLDGTLLQFSQEAFIEVYFTELKKVFVNLGLETGAAVNALWAGTMSMMKNDGAMRNSQRFWRTFSEHTGITGDRLKTIEAACDGFYSNEFNVVKSVLRPCDIPRRLVRAMISRGFGVVLATNPLFPLCAVESRLGWIGLDTSDFLLVTHYDNSTFCKPDPRYYNEIYLKINKSPEQCLMAGNNPVEDMHAGKTGAETYLVTDFLENESGEDVTAYNRGTLAELETYLTSLPDVSK